MLGELLTMLKPLTALRSKTWDKLGTHDFAGGFVKKQVTS